MSGDITGVEALKFSCIQEKSSISRNIPEEGEENIQENKSLLHEEFWARLLGLTAQTQDIMMKAREEAINSKKEWTKNYTKLTQEIFKPVFQIINTKRRRILKSKNFIRAWGISQGSSSTFINKNLFKVPIRLNKN